MLSKRGNFDSVFSEPVHDFIIKADEVRITSYNVCYTKLLRGGGENDLRTTVEIAKRTVENGMNFLLDFHYSDFWADPAKQVKPKAWENLNINALETAVYLHTIDTLKALKNQGVSPAMVQVGNEITNGLLRNNFV